MSLFRVKICGIKTVADALGAANAGADAIGLNFYQQSSRFVNPKTAATISKSLSAKSPSEESRESSTSQSRPKIVGVFVNETESTICDTAKSCGLDAIQLHGDEPPDFVRRIHNSSGLPILRAFALRVSEAARVIEFCHELDGRPKLAGVLIDACVPGRFGGTGITADWPLAANLVEELRPLEIPLILAGGLNPENVREAIRATSAYGVDVASGVESAAGDKDQRLVSQFVGNAAECRQKQ